MKGPSGAPVTTTLIKTMQLNNKFKIGQVIFVFMPTKYVVVPMRIAEENVVRSLQGERTTYRVIYGPSTNAKIIDLTALLEGECQIFETPQRAREALLEQARATIDKVVGLAVKNASAWYPPSVDVNQQQIQTLDFETDTEAPAEPQEPIVDLGNGVVARVKFGNQPT